MRNWLLRAAIVLQLLVLFSMFVAKAPGQEKKTPTEAYIVVQNITTKPGTKVEIVGLKPTYVASAKVGALPKVEMDGNVYLFRGRELRLRPSPLAGKLNIFLEGTVSSIVVIEVPEGIPVYFGKRPEPAKKEIEPPKKGL